MSRPLAVCAAVLLSAFASCTGGADVDEAALEADIAAGLLPTDPSAVTSVSCPGAADAEPGDELSCTVLIDDQALPVDVAFDRDGSVLVVPRLQVLDGAAASAQLAERFSADLGVVTDVECSDRYIVLAPDVTFVCVATDDKGVARSLDVTVDEAGRMQVAIS